uniref:Uncharacterized protein n=1 Tax=Anguilla anguilla TaxID=7936 RepID=A0A0E9WXD1_ANGAN
MREMKNCETDAHTRYTNTVKQRFPISIFLCAGKDEGPRKSSNANHIYKTKQNNNRAPSKITLRAGAEVDLTITSIQMIIKTFHLYRAIQLALGLSQQE